MKEWLLVSVSICILSGCATVKYVKAGATEADLEADKVDCHNQVLMSPTGMAVSRGTMGKPGVGQGIANQSASQQARREVEQCLESKGWVLETEAK
jgi:hypothetical protein